MHTVTLFEFFYNFLMEKRHLLIQIFLIDSSLFTLFR